MYTFSPEQQRHLERYSGLGADALSTLDAALSIVTCEGGTDLFWQGDDADAAYLIVSGSCVVIRELSDGDGVELARFGPGVPLGELGLIAGSPRKATVSCTQPTTLIRIDRAGFDRALDEGTSAAWVLYQRILATAEQRRRSTLERVLAEPKPGRLYGPTTEQLLALLVKS